MFGWIFFLNNWNDLLLLLIIKFFKSYLNSSFCEKIKFINSFSFIFSPRPGTRAADLNLVDKAISKDRLEKIQKILFTHQINTNKSLLKKNINVLVENKIKSQNKLFGRNKYLNSVIIEGKDEHIGKLVNVHIYKYNQNTLFGKITNLKYKAA